MPGITTSFTRRRFVRSLVRPGSHANFKKKKKKNTVAFIIEQTAPLERTEARKREKMSNGLQTLLRRSLSGIHASSSSSSSMYRPGFFGIASQTTSFARSSTSNAADAPTKPKPKPKRDYTNPVVVESIRRKKAAKGIIDDRLPVPEICPTCARRFCRCATPPSALVRPREPLETDCCHSDPRCKFCVFKVYEELLEEYEAAVRAREDED